MNYDLSLGSFSAAVAGQDTSDVTVGTFHTPDLNSQEGDFTARFSWGDGSTDIGSVSELSPGNFTVTADHLYETTGTLPLQLSVADDVTGGRAKVTGSVTVAVPPGTLTTGFEQGFILEVENTGRVCPVNSVLDEHDVMPSERRAYPCPKVNRAIRAKSSSGAAGLASGGTVV